MRQLESEVNHANNIKQSSDFINEDEGPQNAYNNALQKAKDIINAVPDGNEIDHLSNLNNAQRQGEHNEINTAPSRTEVANDLNNAKALNEAMRQLESEVNHANNIKQSSDFINEDEGPQMHTITHFKKRKILSMQYQMVL